MCIAKNQNRRGFSFLEILAVAAILGIVAIILLPQIMTPSDVIKREANERNKATIHAAVERYYINENIWPADDLSDIGANPDYFPKGIPTNPIDGSAYTLNPGTHKVN